MRALLIGRPLENYCQVPGTSSNGERMVVYRGFDGQWEAFIAAQLQTII